MTGQILDLDGGRPTDAAAKGARVPLDGSPLYNGTRLTRWRCSVARIAVDESKIVAFCRENRIRRLALFGSALRDDFRPDSDIDVLVEFEPGSAPGLLRIARMERQLAPAFGGRKVDLRTPEDLSRHFRQSVLDHAEVHYAEG
jgi:predicted nucleotidyltransferase